MIPQQQASAILAARQVVVEGAEEWRKCGQCFSPTSISFLIHDVYDKVKSDYEYGGYIMLDLLSRRRSIRKYREEKIEQEKIDQLIKAALLSPSSRNLKPWEFVVVDDKDLLKQLSQSKKHSAAFLKQAALGIVVLADPEKCDVWVEDTSIASIILHLTAESLGLGSCWIQIRERWYDTDRMAEDYIKELLNIPDQYKVESIIAVGYPAEKKSPHSESEIEYGKIHRNTF